MREPRRTSGMLGRAAAVGALVLGTIGLAAAPAQAAGTVTGFGNGTVGVPQQISVGGYLGCQSATLSVTYANGSTYTSNTATLDGNGNASFTWTPPIAGSITSASLLSLCTPTSLGSATISGTTTTTYFQAPNVAKVGVASKVTIIVQAASPSTYNPTGQVVVKDGNGNTVVTMGLTPGPGTGQAYAYWWWTPAAAGSYVFQATYGGDSNAGGSTSPQDLISASASGGTISLAAPSQLTVGVPVTLVASLVPNTLQGSVGFTLNNQPISPSVPIVNGQASFTWKPTTPGAAVLGANYTTNGGATGSTTDQVTIVAGPVQSDVITLTQPGYGPWAPGGTYSMGNGSNFAFQVSTLSGASITLNDTGPCQTPGVSLVVNQGTGSCTLTAVSPGGNGYGPVTQTYYVTLVPGTQTATLAAPQSSRINKGKTIVLETASQGETNAGQTINWRITQGKGSVCALKYPSSGAVTVKMKAKGVCTVVGTAPAVPGQWQAFRIQRSYQGI